MTTPQDAAMAAGNELFDYECDDLGPKQIATIITRHFAPILAERDAREAVKDEALINAKYEIETQHIDWARFSSGSPDYDPNYKPEYPAVVAEIAKALLPTAGRELLEEVERLRKEHAELLATLDYEKRVAIRVREGNGSENLAATVSATIASLRNRAESAEARVKELEAQALAVESLFNEKLAKRDEAGRKLMALEPYIEHTAWCELSLAPEHKCNCGRDATIAAAPSEWKEKA